MATSRNDDEHATPEVEDREPEVLDTESAEDDHERDAIAWNLPAPRRVQLPVGVGDGLPPSYS